MHITTGDYPEKSNVTKRLNRLYVDMDLLREDLVKAGTPPPPQIPPPLRPLTPTVYPFHHY